MEKIERQRRENMTLDYPNGYLWRIDLWYMVFISNTNPLGEVCKRKRVGWYGVYIYHRNEWEQDVGLTKISIRVCDYRCGENNFSNKYVG